MFWITAGGSRQKKILAGTDADFFCHGQQNAVMHAVHLTNIADQKNSGLEAQSDTRGECSPLLLVSHVDSNTNCGMVEPPQLFFLCNSPASVGVLYLGATSKGSS